MAENQVKDFTLMSKRIIALAATLVFLAGCTTETQIANIPDVLVNIDLNLNNIEAQPLQLDGGFVLLEGGVRGIIVYRVAEGQYVAFERNCTYEPTRACATVEVDDSGFFMVCPCNGSTYSFPDGLPTGGPATIRLKQYQTFIDGNFLLIRNNF